MIRTEGTIIVPAPYPNFHAVWRTFGLGFAESLLNMELERREQAIMAACCAAQSARPGQQRAFYVDRRTGMVGRLRYGSLPTYQRPTCLADSGP